MSLQKRRFIFVYLVKYHRIRKSFYRQIDKYICLNDSQIDLLRGIGFDREKIEKKYNYVPDKGTEIGLVKRDALPERYAVYYGRIGEEKGIRLLMEMWEKIPDIPLVVMGSGPMEQEFCDWADTKGHVHYLGYDFAS